MMLRNPDTDWMFPPPSEDTSFKNRWAALEPSMSVAEAYKMGGLANLVPSGSILEHTYPTPPEQVWRDYDKAQVAQEKARAKAQAEAEFFGPRQGPMAGQETSHVPNKMIETLLPSTLTDAALMAGTGPFGRAVAIMGATFDPDVAQAGKTKLPVGALGRAAEAPAAGVKNWTIGDIAAPSGPTFNVRTRQRYAPIEGPVNAGLDAPINKRIQTVDDPQRMMYPRIYARPDEIVQSAAANIAPESPAMKRLFGVTRDDLYEISKSRDAGTLEPRYIVAPGAKNENYAAQAVMTDKNAQRLVDTMGLALQHPELRKTIGWYMMDPLYHDMVRLHGVDAAKQKYWDFINFKGMASPAAPVDAEIARGTAAHWLYNQGRFPDFVKYGGVPEKQREAMTGYPKDMLWVPGHSYHRTSQVRPMQAFIDRGLVHESENPKVTTYLTAHGTPEVGYQMTYPVQDSHIARSSGFADTRKAVTQGTVGGELSMAEYMTHLPWYRDKVAAPLGLYAGQAQPLQWSTFAKQTGVKSLIGAPKLELLADQIMKASRRLGISPEHARDLILSGGAGAGALMLAPQMGGLAAQDQYSQ